MSKRRNFTPQVKPLDIQLIVSLAIIMVTTLGATIPLYIHSSSQIQAIQEEIRDFHGRLCTIEKERR